MRERLKKGIVRTCLTLGIFLLVLSLIVIPQKVKAQTNETTTNSVYITLTVQVLDINLAQDVATVKIYAYIYNYPYNDTSLAPYITGTGGVIIVCQNISPGSENGWTYQGESNDTSWFLEGNGAMFPFDSYVLQFALQNGTLVVNCPLASKTSIAVFDGPKSLSLTDQWVHNGTLIPTTYDKNQVGQGKGFQEMVVHIERTGNTFDTDFLELLMPIIACYYLLAATLMLDPEKLSERLAVNVALFVFVSTFLLAIQSFLPYRSSLSFPEFLLVNLVISNTIFGIFSIAANQKLLSRPIMKIFSVLFALSFFLIVYYVTLYNTMGLAPLWIVAYVIFPAYFLWFPFENIKNWSIKKNSKPIRALFIGTIIATVAFILAFFFPLIIVAYLFGSMIAGLLIGYRGRSILLSFFSCVLGSNLGGFMLGLIFGGFTGAINDIMLFGLLGYIFGFLVVLYGFSGSVLRVYYLKRKVFPVQDKFKSIQDVSTD